MSDTTHKHKWELAVQHMHGTFIKNETYECECGVEKIDNYDLPGGKCEHCPN